MSTGTQQLSADDKERIARNKAEAIKRAAARKEREAAVNSTSISANIPQRTTNVIFPAPVFTKQVHAAKSLASVQINRPQSSTSSAKKLSFTSSSASSIGGNRSIPEFFILPNSSTTLPKPHVNVQFRILSMDRFKVFFSPFHMAILDAIKSIPSRHYDEREKMWSLSINDLKIADKVLSSLMVVDVTIDSIPENVVRLLTTDEQYKEGVPNDLSYVIDPTLLNKLFPYQRKGVSYGIEKRGRVLIADEMGLGKSVQALTIARYYKAEWPLLIVCPASVKSAWGGQISTFIPCIQRIYTIEKGSDPLPEARTSNTVVIMSYDQMVQKHKVLLQSNYYVVIFDESHMLKDIKAKRTQVAHDISKRASRVILLSGTPALSRPAELFSQIRLVNDRLFTNFQQFAIRYCDGRQGRFCFEAKGCTNSEELSAILSKKIMIRRLKADVLADLPDKRREVVYLSGDSIDSRMDSLQKAKQAFEENSRKHAGAHSGSNECLLEYFNLTGIVKAAAVCNHILDNYFYPDAPKRKLLIFGHHQIVLDTIQVEVHKRNLRSIRIDGHTPAKDRGDLCKAFQEDPDILVAVLSMTAAGVGITLTAATIVVFAELHWNPGTLMQAEDRAHRVGQKDCVFVQYLVARNTADDVMWPLIQKKIDVLGQVNLSSDSFRDAEKTHLDCSETLNHDIGRYLGVIADKEMENPPKRAKKNE